MGRDRAGAVAAVTVWWLARCAGAVWLELATTTTKCLSEEIQSNVVVIGDYSILYEEHPVRPLVSAKVTSPYGDVLHHSDKVTHGQFAFTSAESGNYLACFKVEVLEKGMVINLNLDWKTGIATRDWDAIAKKEKLEGVALELVKLETAVRGIHENLLYLRSKEADMRDVSEWTNAKITLLSLVSLTVCITVSVLQFRHLKQYFQKKKLI
ncbi:hypothetical protein PR202_gb02935 [Eleusine coracana subsp. coracana]|uniref:GOLD domain-containing protein n=1 Tax=Eleusine coracana subsp. coracana TaxID=191504 RepID=A0AAV5E1K6_ELECO|nr:hypothetical protein PR202_gb02935 [Eleusine coracana subsp. coracana]